MVRKLFSYNAAARGSHTLRRAAALSLCIGAAMALIGGAVGAGTAQASFTYAANSWGECNTKRPFADGYSNMMFSQVLTGGRASNYSGASCLYWGRANRAPGGWVPFYMGVNWSRACQIDANGRPYQLWWRAPDSTYWCTVT
jgi:hypothetical protein